MGVAAQIGGYAAGSAASLGRSPGSAVSVSVVEPLEHSGLAALHAAVAAIVPVSAFPTLSVARPVADPASVFAGLLP